MIDMLTGFAERNWARPYEIATSLVGLLLLGGLFAEPLATGSNVLSALSAESWANGLTTANTWMQGHQVLGQGAVAAVGAALAVALAAVPNIENPPSRPASTFWVLVGIAVYGHVALLYLGIWIVIALVIRMVVEWHLNKGRSFKERVSPLEVAVACLVDVIVGAIWLPLVILLWIFTPRGGFTARRSG